MAYTAHLDNLTVAVEVPFWRRVRGREVLITPRQYGLVARVFGGYTGSQRDLAKATGYTIGGLCQALHQLQSLGLLVVQTTRGRLGKTIVRARRGIKVLERAVLNVHQRLVGSYSPSQRVREKPHREIVNISGWDRFRRRGPYLRGAS